MRYFKKELPTNRLMLPNGRALNFEYADPNDLGHLKTEDGYIIAELESAIARKVGGVLHSNEAEYAAFEQKKSNTPSPNLPPRGQSAISAQLLRTMRSQKVRLGGAEAATSAAPVKPQEPPPQPLTVVDRFPRLGPSRVK